MKMGTVAVGGRKISTVVKIAARIMERTKRVRLPSRSASEFDTATPASSEANPKPLNQLKSCSLPEQYLKKGNITLPRIEMAMK